MFELHLDMYQTVGLAAVVFWLGNLLIKKSSFLSNIIFLHHWSGVLYLQYLTLFLLRVGQ